MKPSIHLLTLALVALVVPEGAARADEVVAFRTRDAVSLDEPPARILESGSQPDVLHLAIATPSRTGPDAGAILCYAMAPGAPTGGALRLVRSVSIDQGRSWSAPDPLTINGLTPARQSEAAGGWAAGPSAVQLDDGRVRLYFLAPRAESADPGRRVVPGRQGASELRVCSAISNDGLTFALEDGDRWTLPGSSDPEVIRLPDNRPDDGDTRRIGPWLMFLARDGSTLLATSRDGLAWTRDETFSWPSVAHPAAALAAPGSRNVRLLGQDRKGLVHGLFDPSTGLVKTEPRPRTGGGGVSGQPSLVHCGDGVLLLVCTRPMSDKPGRDPTTPPGIPTHPAPDQPPAKPPSPRNPESPVPPDFPTPPPVPADNP